MAIPKVSIIVPIYKTEQYLERCMTTIRNQTLEDIEIILVDDGSPDGAPALCDKYAQEDSRIKVVHKKNAGLGMARNTGLENATGEYVGFVDSDDYIDLDMYEVLYNTAKKYDAELAMSGCRFVGGNMFNQSGESIEKPYFSEETPFAEDDIKDLLLGVAGALPHEPDDSRYGVSVWKNIFKRSVIEEYNVRFLSERIILSEDTLFMMDYIHCIKSAVGVPGTYYNYCRNGDSLSKAYKKERFPKSLVFLKELEMRLAKDVSKEEYQIYLDRLTQGFGRILCSQEIMHAQENKIKFGDLRKRLKEICTCQEISGALKNFPWYKLPIKQAVFAFTIKYRLYLLQKIIVVFRGR